MTVQEMKKKGLELRRDALTMIANAGSGHPGGSLSVMDILVSIYYYEAKNIDPKDPRRVDRDRVILSKGHACPALYAVLADQGFFPKEECMSLRTPHSRLQGHPDPKKLPGVDSCSGSLGQGTSVAVGLAMGAKAAKKDTRVFLIVGDGELNEGQCWEAAMCAAQYKLDNLTWIVDKNNLQIMGTNAQVMDLGCLEDKFRCFGFETCTVDGHDYEQLLAAYAAPANGKPKCIIANTVKGKGVSFMEDQVGWHGTAPKPEQLAQALEELEKEAAAL